MYQLGEIIETTSGARVKIIRSGSGRFVCVRDDGMPMYGAQRMYDVADHVLRYGGTFDPSAPGKPLHF